MSPKLVRIITAVQTRATDRNLMQKEHAIKDAALRTE